MYGFIEIRFDLTEIWTAKWHYSQVTSFQHSRCQSERPNCLNQMFKVSPFCMDTFAKSSTPLVHCSINNALIKSTPLFNQSFFQMVDVTDLAAVDSKSRSPPDWDLNCSVANPVGWWSQVSLLTAVQQSHGLGGMEHCLAGRWRNHQTHNERLAATVVCCLHSHSSVTEICDSSWKKIENLLNGTSDLY